MDNIYQNFNQAEGDFTSSRKYIQEFGKNDSAKINTSKIFNVSCALQATLIPKTDGSDRYYSLKVTTQIEQEGNKITRTVQSSKGWGYFHEEDLKHMTFIYSLWADYQGNMIAPKNSNCKHDVTKWLDGTMPKQPSGPDQRGPCKWGGSPPPEYDSCKTTFPAPSKNSSGYEIANTIQANINCQYFDERNADQTYCVVLGNINIKSAAPLPGETKHWCWVLDAMYRGLYDSFSSLTPHPTQQALKYPCNQPDITEIGARKHYWHGFYNYAYLNCYGTFKNVIGNPKDAPHSLQKQSNFCASFFKDQDASFNTRDQDGTDGKRAGDLLFIDVDWEKVEPADPGGDRLLLQGLHLHDGVRREGKS